MNTLTDCPQVDNPRIQLPVRSTGGLPLFIVRGFDLYWVCIGTEKGGKTDCITPRWLWSRPRERDVASQRG